MRSEIKDAAAQVRLLSLWRAVLCQGEHLSLLMFVVQNKTLFLTNTENYNFDTRQRNNLYFPQANLTIYQKETFFQG